jgi:hypothetical protein
MLGPAECRTRNAEDVKSLGQCLCAIPAKAGIQYYQSVLDSRVRGNDDFSTFYEFIKFWIWNFGHWELFVIWGLVLGAWAYRIKRLKQN